MADGYFGLIDWLTRLNKKVFVDLKFFDIPQTSERRLRGLRNRA